ncbi:MAG: hypothetical protein GQ525_16675 [Draconibacterium sp.]|nr:hypothetical protein [Draconibacterium sp.]
MYNLSGIGDVNTTAFYSPTPKNGLALGIGYGSEENNFISKIDKVIVEVK